MVWESHSFHRWKKTKGARQVVKSHFDMEVRGMGREHGKRECHLTTLDQSPPFDSAILTYFHRLGYVEPVNLMYFSQNVMAKLMDRDKYSSGSTIK